MFKLTVQNVSNAKKPGEVEEIQRYKDNTLAFVKPAANAECTGWVKSMGYTPRHTANWTASQRNTVLTRRIRATNNTSGKTHTFEFVLTKE